MDGKPRWRSDRAFRILLQHLPGAAYACDPQGRIRLYTPGAVQLWGRKPDIGEDRWCGAWKIFHPDGTELPSDQCPTAIAIKDGRPVRTVEILIERPDGVRRRVLPNASPLRDASGTLLGAVSILVDVTEAADPAADPGVPVGGDPSFIAALEASFEWVMILDGEARMRYVNPAGLAMMGHPPAAPHGSALEFVAPEHRHLWQAHHRRVCAGEALSWEYEAFNPNGERRWVEAHAACLPMSAAGSTQVAVMRDITEAKAGEQRDAARRQQLERTNERLRIEIEARKAGELAQARLAAIVESSDDAIVSKTLDGIITSWNGAAERLFGHSAEEATGRSILLIVPPERHGEEAQILRRLRGGERLEHFETQRLHKDGHRLEVSLTVSPVRGPSGAIVGVSKIARDVSERKRVESDREEILAAERHARAEAQRVNRLKDEFLATVSHELRAPLNAILGWAQLLVAGKLNAAQTVKAGEVLARNARTQKRLIDDLLDMSRIASGKLRLEMQWVDLAMVIEGAIETVRPSAEAKAIVVEKTFDPLAAPISGDPARLQQVMWNLLSNAVKFTPNGGRVQVSLWRVGSQIEISVSDNGQGIRPDFLPLLFERFNQGDASTTRRHGGLGLGLAIVRQLVELHGGSVAARSAGDGKGATFDVYLPLTAAALAQSPQGDTQGAALLSLDGDAADLSRLKVLVVDDEQDARELIRRLLSECGAQVTTADSAAGGMLALEHDLPDVLISDIGMPDTDGYQFLREVRGCTHGAAKVPAIALTALARSEDRTRALRAGYIAHVAKPVEASELIATIAVVTGRAG
jgi:PAS domain S-box-containing protein